MALFPSVPFGILQSTDLSTIGTIPPYRYQVRRVETQRSGRSVFYDFKEQRNAKGFKITDFYFSWSKIPTKQKNFLRYFYDQQLAETVPFSLSFDSIGYSGCRFVGQFKADNTSHGLWNVSLQARTLNSIGINPVGPGARVIVPSAAGTVTLGWKSQWNQRQVGFPDGQVHIAFNGSGGATLAYVAGSGGTGSTGAPAGNFYNKWGYNGTWYVEPNGPLGVGPVSIGTGFTAGQELVIQMSTTGGANTAPGTTYVSGPGAGNSDGEEHSTGV